MSNPNSNIYTTLADLEHIPESVHNYLPSVIENQLDRYDSPETTDVFIAGGLGVLSGCLPNVWGRYHNGIHHPNLYIFVVAPAGGGKGAITDAAQLARPVHRKVKEEGKAEQARWEEQSQQKEEAEDASSKPPDQRLIVPGNTSAAALIQILNDNDGRALMVETEADTLSQTMEKEWGNYSDLLRKAHPHEPISSGRIDDVREVETPRLSVVLSGTPDQLPRLVGEVGNGLWSRLCLYGFLPTTEWKDVAPEYAGDGGTYDLEVSENHGEEVLNLYQVLENRTDPLQIRLREADWDELNELGQEAKQKVHKNMGFNGDGIVHRMGAHIFRLASTLAVWDLWDRSEGLTDQDRSQITVDAGSFAAAYHLGRVFAKHNLDLLDAMSDGPLGSGVAKLEQKWFGSLPEQFKTAEAIERAENFQISERTAKRRLSEWVEEGILSRLKQGHYEKTTDDS